MAKLGSSALFQFNGAVEVYTYITSTTTGKPTYFDTDLIVKNRNPIALDVASEHKVYLEEDSAYRFVINDADGNTLHTVDDVYPIVDPAKLTADLDVDGNSIVSSSGGDIALTPNGPGYLILDGLKWPTADGTNGQVISAKGDGTIVWIPNATRWFPDKTPQLGANLDGNTFNVKFTSGSGITDDSLNEYIIFRTTNEAINYVDVTNAATGNAPSITATGDDADVGITINGKGTGAIRINNSYFLPISDGSTNQALISDGAGGLTFGDPVSGGASDEDIAAATASTAIAPRPLYLHPLIPIAYYWRKSGSSDVSEGFSTISQAGTHLRLWFDTPMSDTNYVVIATSAQSSDTSRFVIVDHSTTTYIDIKSRLKTSAQSYTPSSFMIMVFGG